METSFACATRKVYLSLLVLLVLIVMVESARELKSAPASASATATYIVFTEMPKNKEDPKAFHLRTLSTVLGSAQAAKDSLMYVYNAVGPGFAASLTPQQAHKLSKLPGVRSVTKESKPLKLLDGGDGLKRGGGGMKLGAGGGDGMNRGVGAMKLGANDGAMKPGATDGAMKLGGGGGMNRGVGAMKSGANDGAMKPN